MQINFRCSFISQNSWFSMKTRCTIAVTGITWPRSPAPGPRLTSNSRPTCTTPSGFWHWMVWASASPVYPPGCSRQMRLVLNKSFRFFFNSRTGIEFEFFFPPLGNNSICHRIFPAPDENPTDVQGYGTEYNNLVISWKVIKLPWLFISIPKHSLSVREQDQPNYPSYFSSCSALMCHVSICTDQWLTMAEFAGKNKLFIIFLHSWQPLSSLQANGPGLRYKVMWKQKARDLDWTSVTVANNSKFVVSGTPTFALYELKVQAMNDHGAGPEPHVAHGYSGEDCECKHAKKKQNKKNWSSKQKNLYA